MIQTLKIKHQQDYSKELILAKKIAQFGIETKSRSSADVKHFGLKSIISNQILKKYSSSKTIKSVKSVKLTIPNQGIKVVDNQIYIPCIKLYIPIYFNNNFKKINQIEIGKTYVYISVTYNNLSEYIPKTYLGIDRNSTKHIIVGSNIDTGKVIKLGKSCNHIHKKYSNIRKFLQKKGKFKKLKQIKHRESNIIKNINHHISKKIVKESINNQAGIVLENLKGIRKSAKTRKKQRYTLNSWSFYQLEQFIKYKSEKQGVPLFYTEPQYTSQRCSICGHIEKSNRKTSSLFQCKQCGKVENADVNAGFNIAYKQKYGISQFIKESDLMKGNTDVPKVAIVN